MLKKILKIAPIALFATACETHVIKNFDLYQAQSFLPNEKVQAQFMPKEEDLKRDTPTVIFMEFTDSYVDNFYNDKSVKVAQFVSSDIQTELTDSNLINLISRPNKQTLSEVRLKQIISGSKDVKNADYIITGMVINLDFSGRKVTEPIYRTDEYGNKIQIGTKEFHQYTANTGGVVQVYSLPNLILQKSISFSGNYTSKETPPGQGLKSLWTGEQLKSYDEGIARVAIDNAIADASKQLKTHFTRPGYIMEKRVLVEKPKKKPIYKITLGSLDGLKPAAKVQLFEQKAEKNPFTNGETITETKVGTGVVSDRINSDFSWIKLHKKTDPNVVKMGQKLKIVY